jgi:S1-C subfamily serine protease
MNEQDSPEPVPGQPPHTQHPEQVPPTPSGSPTEPTQQLHREPTQQFPQPPAAPPQPTASPWGPPTQHGGWTGYSGGGLPPTGGYGTPAGSPTAPLPGGFGTQPAPRRSGRMRIALAGLAVGALIGGGAGAAVVALTDSTTTTANGSPAAQSVVIQDPKTATTATAAAAKAAPSVVTIYVAGSSGSGSGSGVILTDDGYVLTNNHVVTLEGQGTGSVQARTADGHLYDAKVVGTDATADLAVIKLNNASGLTPATFADSDKVQVGDVAVAIGAPLGLSNTVTDGIISATNRAVATGSTRNDSTVIDAIQTDAAINPGNSGGALVNGAGEVIGINTAIATVASGVPGGDSQGGNIGVGFAIPSNTAQRIGQQIIEKGSATHAVLGVSARTESVTGNADIGNGALIVQVNPNGAAAKAGLRAGDVITAVGKRPVTTSTELTAAVRSQAPGDTVQLTVQRGGSSQTVQVTLGSN